MGITYSRFVEGLTKADVRIDRQVISNMAIEDPEAFAVLVETAKAHTGK